MSIYRDGKRFGKPDEGDMFRSEYDMSSFSIYDPIQRDTQPLIVQTINLAVAGTKIIRVPGRGFVPYYWLTNSTNRARQLSGFINVSINSDGSDLTQIFPAKHNRGFIGSFTTLYLTWAAQANTSVDFVIHRSCNTPWMTDDYETETSSGVITGNYIYDTDGHLEIDLTDQGAFDGIPFFQNGLNANADIYMDKGSINGLSYLYDNLGNLVIDLTDEGNFDGIPSFPRGVNVNGVLSIDNHGQLYYGDGSPFTTSQGGNRGEASILYPSGTGIGNFVDGEGIYFYDGTTFLDSSGNIYCATGAVVFDASGDLSVPGNSSVSGSVTESGYQISTPTTGNTIACAANAPGLFIHPAGTLAALTIKLPATPLDGQRYYVACTNTITTVTWQDAGGTAANVVGGPSTFGGVAGGATFSYIGNTSKWYRT